MITNFNISCEYQQLELENRLYLLPTNAAKVIYTDTYNEVVFIGSYDDIILLEGNGLSFSEQTSFDERFRFEKQISLTVDGYVTLAESNPTVVIEDKKGDFYIVNSDFSATLTHTYTLQTGNNTTELSFEVQSNLPTLKLSNFEPNFANACKKYISTNINSVKLTASKSSLSTWKKLLVTQGEFSKIEPLKDTIELIEEFDGEKYTVTLTFDIPLIDDWQIKLLQFSENRYKGYILLEDGTTVFVGYENGLFPSFQINGDVVKIRLTEVAANGLIYSDEYAIIDTDLPNSIEFTGATCNNYNFESTCNWEVESKPDFITITPTSGQANTEYALTICNTDTETGYDEAPLVITSCNATISTNVIIKNPIYRYTATTETICVDLSVTSVTLSDSYISINPEETKTLSFTISPDYAFDKSVTWSSSNPSIATVDENGVVSGVSGGNCVITITTNDGGLTAQCSISVIEIIERTVSGDPYCNNCSKYIDVFDEISYDGGETWQVTSSSSTLIEADSADCGYRERTITDTYCNGYDKYEDAFNQVSCDSGSTWETVSSSSTMIEECSPECGCFKIIMYGINDDDSISGAVRCSSSNTLTHFEVNDIAGDNTLVPLSGYQHVIIGNCCTTIGEGAFCESYGTQFSRPTIEDFENFDRITVINNYGMAYLRGLKNIDISNIVTLGSGAFSGCYSLSSVTIPSAITTINAGTFKNCSGLTSVTIENGIEVIGTSSFENCFSLSSITIPSSVTSIINYVFQGCSGLTSIVLPDSVTSIGIYVFSDCISLTSATIGSGITSIDSSVFYNCSGLTSLTVKAVTPPTLNNIFSNTPSTMRIYVPSGSVEAYKTAIYWRYYADRIYPIS